MQVLCCIAIWLCLIVRNILGYFQLLGQVLDLVHQPEVMGNQPLPRASLEVILIQGLLSQIMILIGDFVICWRAWVLLPHDKFWRFVLSIIMICNIGLNIAPAFEVPGLVTLQVASQADSFILGWVSIATSMVVNITATSLISWKAWAHHRTMREVPAWRKSCAERILLLLVESGAIFLVIQLFYMIGGILNAGLTVSKSFSSTLPTCHDYHYTL
ncbi:hypothetical protein BDP27DRAFT_649728 [Rhodocollybia butyracea]|uniref:Uncharacterized protein n=1 Tax=Rhodocollybia butyracea TaxID=206335 RepID=A0A9P5TW32_9AGAR|nr:hypothetical protein BDP27DRAFT_649728 [Rhodocollybia butyracea]